MIGNVVGNYKITAKIGEGGMGSVFRGIDIMLEREVAIKMLRPELASQPQVVERFRSEAVTLAKLNHPNIATLHSFFRQGDDFFMVMEYVRGETLDSLIRRMGAMDVARAIALFCHALEGVGHAHKNGVIHRDIKPANIMLTDAGLVKVMDFGIARVLGSARMTRQGNIVGTIEYMAPEQVRGEETDARADIYALGILFYEMLTGRVPFESKSEFELMRAHIEDAPPPPRKFAGHIPLPVEQAIMRALAKRAEARFQTADEFRAVLLNGMSAASKRLDSAGINYKAPATNLLNADLVTPPAAPATPSGAVLAQDVQKETRLADAGSQINSGQIKETRLGGAGEVQSAPAGTISAGPQASQALTSLMGKLNWKHYAAGAAAFLLVVVGVPLAFMGGADSAPPAQPPAVAQPAANAQPASSSPVEGGAAPAPSQSVSPTPTASVVDSPAPSKGAEAEASATESAKPGRPRSARPDKTAQAPASEPPPQSQPVVAPPQPQPQPQPKEEKPAVVAQDDKEEKKRIKKEEEKREKEKKKDKLDVVKKGLKRIFGG